MEKVSLTCYLKKKLTRKWLRWIETIITQPAVYWILLISKKNYRLIAIDLSKKTKKTPAVAGADNNTKVAFKNCAPFRKCRTEIIDTFTDEAEHIILQGLCTIWLNTVIIILILREVYGSLKEMK